MNFYEPTENQTETVYSGQYYFDDTSQSSNTDEFETLEADDFLIVFDSITDFEKEIGIDGVVDDNNEQSLEDNVLTLPKRHIYSKDATNAYSQPETTLTTLLSNTTITPHATSNLSPTYTSTLSYSHNTTEDRGSSQHSHSRTSTLTSSWSPIVRPLKQDSSKTNSVDVSNHTGNTSDWAVVPSPSIKYQAQPQPQQVNVDSSQKTNQEESDNHRKRQERLATLMDKRRQQFQLQQEQDNTLVPELLDHLQRQKQHLDHQQQLEQQKRTTHDTALCRAMETALSEAVYAAEAYGIGRLRTTPPSSPIKYCKEPIIITQQQEENLDPENPDPWMEEERHYLLLGRIKRAKYLQDLRVAKDMGKNRPPPPVYHPTGLPRHDPDMPLSRSGAGLSVSGAMLDAVVSNSRASPANRWVPQAPHDLDHQRKVLKDRSLSTSGTNAASSRIKTPTLLATNLPDGITEPTIHTLQPDGLTSVLLNQSNHSATLCFMTIESAVTFRRKYDRSLLEGRRLSIHFAYT